MAGAGSVAGSVGTAAGLWVGWSGLAARGVGGVRAGAVGAAISGVGGAGASEATVAAPVAAKTAAPTTTDCTVASHGIDATPAMAAVAADPPAEALR